MTTPQRSGSRRPGHEGADPSRPGWFSGRTRLVTVASIVAVGLAGATAVSANMGILDSADTSDVGNLSAAGDLVPASTQVVDVYLDDPSTTAAAPVVTVAASAATAGVQEYAVDVAGTVAVSADAAGIHLVSVAPTAGWTWSLVQPDASHLTVTLTDGVRTLEFVAAAGADGTIAASVNEPILAPAAPSGGSGYGDDDDDDDEEHEGGEDDD